MSKVSKLVEKSLQEARKYVWAIMYSKTREIYSVYETEEGAKKAYEEMKSKYGDKATIEITKYPLNP